MPHDKKEYTNQCASCKHGLVIATINTAQDFADGFIFCGYFKSAPLKFRGCIVTECTRYKRDEPRSKG